MLEHPLGESQLGARPVEVVPFSADPKVDVAGQVIGEEAHGVHQAEEAAGHRQRPPLVLGEEAPDPGEIAARERLEEREVEVHAGQVALVLGCPAGAGPHELAEVGEQVALHHRVEVDHAEGLAALPIEQQVVQLAVVVHDAARQGGDLECGQLAFEVGDAAAQRLDLDARGHGAAAGVAANRGLEGLHAPPEVVEVRDRRVERGRGQIGQHRRECAEGAGRLEGLGRALDCVEAARALHEPEGPPDAPRGVDVERAPVAGRNELKAAALGLRKPALPQLLAQVAGYPHEVLHQRLGVAEHLRIEPLVEQAHGAARGGVARHEGPVNVAAAVPLRALVAALDREGRSDGAQALFRVALSSHGRNPMPGRCPDDPAPERGRNPIAPMGRVPPGMTERIRREWA